MGSRAWKRKLFLIAGLLMVVLLGWMEQRARLVKVPESAKRPEEEKETELPENNLEEPEESDCIRVLIQSDDFVSSFQEKVTVVCLNASVVQEEDGSRECAAGESFSFSGEDEQKTGEIITFSGVDGEGKFQLTGLKRGYENPVYDGKLELHKTDEGYLVINELPLESYLTRVVPSEMPAYYPLEALKAQAVCARTYALRQKENSRMEDGIPADVDDSVSYQVYNNQPTAENCTRAVEETKGQVLTKAGELLETLYYSTSCGIDLSRNLSDEAVFCAFLETDNETDYEREEPWYRWSTYFSMEELTKLALEAGFEKIGDVKALLPGEREESGRLSELTIEGSDGIKSVEGEYRIRKFLNPTESGVTLQDGSKGTDLGMLPSAYFYLMPVYEEETLCGYQVTGGGYGHGNGLSQNGAKHMAEAGVDYQKILTYYYGEIELHDWFDTEH